LTGSQEVEGSIPFSSTNKINTLAIEEMAFFVDCKNIAKKTFSHPGTQRAAIVITVGRF